MRHVMVWFTCSAQGCDARAEHLVRAMTDIGNRNVIGHWAKITTEDMPESWSRYHRADVVELRDCERTFCPDHARIDVPADDVEATDRR